jgi:hypothetical protein
MTRTRTIGLATAALLLAVSAGAHAQAFPDVKYLDGLKGIGRTRGTLQLKGGELRFADRKGRPVFARLLVPAQAWVGQEKVTSDGCMARNFALLPVLIPLALSAGGGNPWIGGCGRTRDIVQVRIGEGADAVVLRLRAPEKQVRAIVEAVNAAALATAPLAGELGRDPN